MIRIERGACPACLADTPQEGDSYKKKEVVKALWDMQHGKCCYSEMKLPAKGHGKAVEHFHPKARFGWLRNQWTNLLLVSPQCNGRKRDLFPLKLTENEDETKVVYLEAPAQGQPAIIDPSDPAIDPEEHLTYVLDDSTPLYGQVVPRNDSELGQETLRVTGIDDDFFFGLRKQHLLWIIGVAYSNILRAEATGNADALGPAVAAFQQLLSAQEPFAGLARQFAREKKLQRFGLEVPGPANP